MEQVRHHKAMCLTQGVTHSCRGTKGDKMEIYNAYDEETRVLARLKIQVTRSEMDELPQGDYIKGTRFMDDDYVLDKLTICSSQRDFLEFPFATVMDALLEAARADYFFECEKHWESYDMEGIENPGEKDNENGC
jgi:hypothetical protein